MKRSLVAGERMSSPQADSQLLFFCRCLLSVRTSSTFRCAGGMLRLTVNAENSDFVMSFAEIENREIVVLMNAG